MIAVDSGEEDSVFSGRTDHRHVHSLYAYLLFDEFLRIIGIRAPQMRGVLHLDVAILNPKIDWLLGLARDPQSIISGEAQFGPPEAAAVRFSPQAGGRPFPADGEAPDRRAGRPRERSVDEEQR